MKVIITYLLIVPVILVSFTATARGDEEIALPPDVTEDIRLPGNAIPIGLDEVTRLALLQNPDVIIAGLAYDAVTTREQEAESIYDFNLRGKGGWTNDRKPPVYTFYSSKTDERDFLIGLTKLLPMGTLIDFGYSSVRMETDDPLSTVNPGYEQSYEVRVKQPLLENFLGYMDRARISVVNLDIRRFDYMTLNNIESFLLNARNAYWDLLEAQKTFHAENEALKNAADFYRLTKRKLPLGLTEKPDVIAADGNLRRYYITSLIAKSNYENSSDILKSILNLQNDGYLMADDVPLSEPRVDVNGELKLAFEKRFDLKAALLESRKKGLELKINTMGLLPTLDFEGSFALNSLKRHLEDAAGAAWNADGRGYFLGATLDMPLENRKARAMRRRSDIEKRKAFEEIQKVELRIVKDVLVAARNVHITYVAAVQTAKIEVLETEKLEAENKRFIQGRSSSDIIIRFQFDRFEAQKYNIKSSVAHHRTSDSLLRATSSLIDTVSDHMAGRPESGPSEKPEDTQ